MIVRKIKIVQKPESLEAGQVMTGNNTRIYIDDEDFSNSVTNIEFSIGVGNQIGRVRLELVGQIELEGNMKTIKAGNGLEEVLQEI